MTAWVRIRTESGAEVTVSAEYAAMIPGVEILDVPATNVRGRPLPWTRRDGRRPKPRTTVEKEVAKKATKKTAKAPAVADVPKEAIE